MLVSNLPVITKKDLLELFGKYGSCSAILSNGEAVINYSYLSDAVNSFRNLDGIIINNNKIKLEPLFSVDKEGKNDETMQMNKIYIGQTNHLITKVARKTVSKPKLPENYEELNIIDDINYK